MNLLPVFLSKFKTNLAESNFDEPQTYSLSHKCEIQNLREKENKIFVLLPIPTTTSYQKPAKLRFLPSKVELGSDSLGNKFVFWSFELSGSQKQNVEELFTVTIFSVKIEKEKIITRNQYQNNKVNKLFTRPEKYINFKSKGFQKFVQKNGLKMRNNDIISFAKLLNNFVADSLSYGNPITGLYSSEDAIRNLEVDCGGFSSLLVALLRNFKIPARVVLGYLLGPPKTIMHAWVEFMLPDGQWIPADPTIENLTKRRGSKRSGKFGFVGSDHLVFSFGSDLDIKLSGKSMHLDILQNPVVWTSLGKDSIKVSYILEASIVN